MSPTLLLDLRLEAGYTFAPFVVILPGERYYFLCFFCVFFYDLLPACRRKTDHIINMALTNSTHIQYQYTTQTYSHVGHLQKTNKLQFNLH